jgi:hypothetical protein
MIATAADIGPHGLLCMDCDRELRVGDDIRERLLALGKLGSEDCATVEIICAECDEKEIATP